ncbi:MAG: FG-GAP repeat protein, partial [Actinobacteria bacterium]|nr:FG-GAP repeat protein [Actinomycetota bacterium]
MLRSVLSRRRVGLALTAAVIATGLVPIGAAAHAAPDAGSHTEQTPQAAAAPTTLTMHGIGLGGVLNTQVCDFNGDGYGDLGASVRDGFSSAEWSDSEAEQNAAGVTSTYQPRSAQWSNAISDTTKTRRCIGDINGDGYDDVLETSAAGVRSVSVNLYGSAPNAAGKLGDKRFANFSFPATAQFTNPAFGAIGAGAAGDLDGDGLGDFAFSQHLASSGGRTGNGRIWVLAGRSGDLSSTVQTHTMNEAAVQDPSLVVMTIDGAAAGEQLGRIASAGDVDGDGVDDLMVASESAKRIWVIRGQARGAAARQIDLAQLDPNDGWLFATAPSAGSGSAGTSFGSAISVLDDVNGDRVPDYLIGLTSTRTGAGGAVVVFGAAGAAAAAHTVDVDLVARTVTGNGQARGYVITPEGSTDGFGFAVAGLGDVNGDGRSDLLIGAPGYDPVGSTGSK